MSEFHVICTVEEFLTLRVGTTFWRVAPYDIRPQSIQEPIDIVQLRPAAHGSQASVTLRFTDIEEEWTEAVKVTVKHGVCLSKEDAQAHLMNLIVEFESSGTSVKQLQGYEKLREATEDLGLKDPFAEEDEE